MRYILEEQVMNIEANVLNEIMSTIGSVSPETGGIIGTPKDVVCAYYFDRTGSYDSNTYKPDTVTVNRKNRRRG